MTRTSVQLYRDCIRLIKHIAPGHSPKSIALHKMVRTEFSKHKDVTDPATVEALKSGAVRALANYMLFESGAKDEKLGKAMGKFHDSNVRDAKKGVGGGNGKDGKGDER